MKKRWTMKRIVDTLFVLVILGDIATMMMFVMISIKIVVEGCEFVESKHDDSGESQNANNGFGPVDPDGFQNIPEDIDEELPFN